MATVWRAPMQPMPSGNGNNVTSAALTSMLGGLALPQIPSNLIMPGSRMVIECDGSITSTSATPTVTFGFYIGSVAQAIGSKTALAVTAAMAISASASSWPFHIKYSGTFRTLSPSAGVIQGFGILDWWGNVGLTGTGTQNPMPTTFAARTVSTLNTDQVNEVDAGCTLSATTGAPTVVLADFWVEISG